MQQEHLEPVRLAYSVSTDELGEIAADLDAPFLRAVAAHAQGSVSLAARSARSALADLRRAWTTWHELGAPYEATRARVLIGLACRELGDEDTADMELDAARWTFQQLGAAPDVGRIEEPQARARACCPGK